ncbi:hypothetical protein CYY_007646 [Polysphondylium violaceum]|uniref:Uncharacterized protein n=1 Tax=Polysphondylium violaceum TaxID=133409 RepID=A0A8J4UXK1_9MYCE|nr:hypothetical protein CYY_007646 [Polysphondylium violaceum]
MINKHIPSLKLFQRASLFKHRASVVNYPDLDTKYSYAQLLDESESVEKQLSLDNKIDLRQERVSFFLPQNFDYVKTQWGIWRNNAVAVPLAISHPPQELEYVISNSRSKLVVTDDKHYDYIKDITKRLGGDVGVVKIPSTGDTAQYTADYISSIQYHTNTNIDTNTNAMIIYTSGTTNRPKGVVTTHTNIQSQIETLVSSWKWTENDHILEFLPLHHVHGVINVVSCALYSGALLEMMEKFDCKQVIDRILSSGVSTDMTQPITLFMAVPTIYSKLIKYIEDNVHDPAERELIKQGFARLRLMVSGSSALPETVKNRWLELSNHSLLERYGMTEIGMALSNPLEGDRVSGTVGFPLPNVLTKLDTTQGDNNQDTKYQVGELLIKGPSVFKEYFDNPTATKDTFDQDGWFKTGDIAQLDTETGRFKIQGRSSVDIIKYSGYKISALEIEREILDHPDIDECAVVGIPNEEYGQVIGAILVAKKGKKEIPYQEFKQWCSKHLAYYKIPKVILWKSEIPKNAMLKVNKKELVKLFNK